jgi:hypothetical protein
LRKRRVFFFVVAVLVGAAAGIGYGWWVRPMTYTQARLSNLRMDYSTDYVLMVAGIYNREQNLDEARTRLDQLDPGSPERAAREALLNAGQLGYSQTDLQLLANLVQVIEPSGASTRTQTSTTPTVTP